MTWTSHWKSVNEQMGMIEGGVKETVEGQSRSNGGLSDFALPSLCVLLVGGVCCEYGAESDVLLQ